MDAQQQVENSIEENARILYLSCSTPDATCFLVQALT